MLGLVTIGQSPRADLTLDVMPLVAAAAGDVVEHGALDHLSDAQISLLYPKEGEATLVSRLRDGSGAVLGHDQLIPYINQAIDECLSDGATRVILMCTGSFDLGRADHVVRGADELAHSWVVSQLDGARIGVVSPMVGQLAAAAERWKDLTGRTPIQAACDPYSASDEAIVAAVRRVVERGAEAVLLDCIGYRVATAKEAATLTGVPVWAAREAALVHSLACANESPSASMTL